MRLTDLIPPAFGDLYRVLRSKNYLYYFDSYETWDAAEIAAKKYGDAYEKQDILKKVAEATDKVREGKAAYEQDGVCYDNELNIYEFLTALYYVLLNEDQVKLCDLGGALGSTYFRYRSKLPSERLKWNIVEQKHYVDYGKSNIPELDFYYSIEECAGVYNDLNLVMLLSVLPYLDDPYSMIDRIAAIDSVKYVLIDETVCNSIDGDEEKIVLQHVPSNIYEAVYPSHIFNRQRLIQCFENKGFETVFEWTYPGGSIPIKNRFGFEKTVNKGFLFRRN